MEIQEKRHVNYVCLTPIGELDANFSVYMDEKIESLIEEGITNIHVDCSKMTYISSAGLGVFLSHLDEIKNQNGHLIFSNMSGNVCDAFELLGLDQLVNIIEEESEITTIINS